MALDRVLSMVFRAAELVFAAIVAGVNGEYLRKSRASDWANGRFIYTEVVAALSIVLALIRVIPSAGSFLAWPMDIFTSVLWWVAFGLLVAIVGNGCGSVFDWSNVSPIRGDACGKLKAVIAFSFLSAVIWLASAAVGYFWVRGREAKVQRRRAWGRNSRA